MEPATTIIGLLGGNAVVSRVVGVHRTRVANWKRPKEKGGTGGIIPHWHHKKLRDYARERGVKLPSFLPEEEEIAA